MAKIKKKIIIKKFKVSKKIKPVKQKKVLIYPPTKRGFGGEKKGDKKKSRYGVGVKKKNVIRKNNKIKPEKSKLYKKPKQLKISTLHKSQGKKSTKQNKVIVKKAIKFSKKIVKQKKKINIHPPKFSQKKFKRARKVIKQKKKIIIKPKKKNIIPIKSRSHGDKAVKIKKAIKKSASHKVIEAKKNIIKKVYTLKTLRSKVSSKAGQPKRVKKTAKRPEGSPNTESPVETLFKAKIKVIGIGGGGGSIVSEIGRSLEKATFVIADTDIRALKKKPGIKYFWFGEDLTHGLGTGVNVELAKRAALGAKEKISSIFKDQDIIIFVASLGGGLGSGATQVFTEAAREFGGITFGIFTMPFKFEGKNKYRIAQNALKSLCQSLNVSLIIPNEKIFKVIDEATPITNAFSTINKSLIESLESLIDLIYNPGIINIDFADLRTILKGMGNSAFLNTVEESGKDRVEKICGRILKNPLLQNSSFKAEKILFNIAGSENLSMFEVEKISSHISSLNQKAKIIFGISKDSKLKNKIKATILMTGAPSGSQIKEEIPREILVKKTEPVKLIVEEQIKQPLKKEATSVKTEKKKIIFKKPLENTQDKSNKTDKKKEKPRSEEHPADKKDDSKDILPASFVPVFEVPSHFRDLRSTPEHSLGTPVLEQKRIDINQTASESNKKTIRRSGLEIKKAEELQEKKRIAQEKEWEIPAFLRKVKN